MTIKDRYEDYTESESLNIINRLFQGRFSSEKEHDAFVDNIVSTSEHPNGTDILYYPEEGVEYGPERVLKAIKTWRAANGKPGFKPE
ncbi:bacteriocin immunity protein [Pseudomonas brassicacearum]|uniref:Bacteriocin immunity protein n=1 Tax=Pseudomonas brassicacearum TaxID=930166 RepID=A0A423JS42_9PSED|nr:bacteriocin immunity protein [Pseudomonas brassicacearum]RON40502.1 bacteriocin immunity protein [Pseudomonas brassicacearum]